MCYSLNYGFTMKKRLCHIILVFHSFLTVIQIINLKLYYALRNNLSCAVYLFVLYGLRVIIHHNLHLTPVESVFEKIHYLYSVTPKGMLENGIVREILNTKLVLLLLIHLLPSKNRPDAHILMTHCLALPTIPGSLLTFSSVGGPLTS